MIKRAVTAFFCIFLLSCALITQNNVQDEIKAPDPVGVDVSSERDGKILRVDIAVGTQDFEYSADINKSGRKAVIILKNNLFKIGSQDICRPVSKLDVTESANGMKLDIYLANKSKMEYEKTGNWIRLTFRAMEPDMEMVSMETFGEWIRPLLSASAFKGSEYHEDYSVIKLNGYPAYAYGNASGRYFLDIFGTKVPAGTVKHSNLITMTYPEGKTRLIFKRNQDFCVDKFNITLGKKCAGYSSLFGFEKEVNNGSESFTFDLTGQPQITERSMRGLTAFGMRNVKLFGNGMERYEDDRVYKVETRVKDGTVWLVFLHDPEMRFKKYFAGDKFFVTFY